MREQLQCKMKKIIVTIILTSIVWVTVLVKVVAMTDERGMVKGAQKAESMRLATSQMRFKHHENNAIAGADFIDATLELATRFGENRGSKINANLFSRAVELHLEAFLEPYGQSYVTGSENGLTILGMPEQTFRIFLHRDYKESFPVGTPSKNVILSLIGHLKSLQKESRGKGSAVSD